MSFDWEKKKGGLMKFKVPGCLIVPWTMYPLERRSLTSQEATKPPAPVTHTFCAAEAAIAIFFCLNRVLLHLYQRIFLFFHFEQCRICRATCGKRYYYCRLKYHHLFTFKYFFSLQNCSCNFGVEIIVG